MSEAIKLTAAMRDDDKAASDWVKAGPFGEGNAVRQLFGSGDLDGGVTMIEACMNGPYDDPNEAENAPTTEAIVTLADVVIDDFSDRAEQVFATRANWLRVVVWNGGDALDTTWWLL